MAESIIKEKVEMELKPFETMCEQTLEHLKRLITGGEGADAQEILTVAKVLGEITDIKKDVVEICYKKSILEAMEEADFGQDYDEEGKLYYTGQPRDSKGRYMSRRSGKGRRMYNDSMMPMDYQMDMDMYDKYDPKYLRDMDKRMGRMYYTDANMSNTNSMNQNGNMSADSKNNPGGSNYDRAKRTFTEGKMMHNSGSQEDNTANMKSLEAIFNVLDAEMKELAPIMSQAEKTFSKQRITNLTNMVK